MKPVSVSQVNEYIAKKLREDYNLRGIAVEGEISGFSKSGPHYYFTLKDSDSMIKCAVWASNAKNFDITILENGKKVVVVADISPYSKGGSYSLSVRYAESAGEGDLIAEFNRIKQKLQEEGLFDQKYKKSIPVFPMRIGVVTSSTGAAVEDIKKIITAKNYLTDILIFPTQVQGTGAVESICENILTANELNRNGFRIDTLIVGRGGGSAEDLMAFNDEKVARTIFSSEIPVISAVGHESDFSISDFVADLRAETPTAAADIAVMNTYELMENIVNASAALYESAKIKLDSERALLQSRADLLYSNMSGKVRDSRNAVEKALISLNENNPENVFSKGYSAVMSEDGIVLGNIDKIEIGEEYKVKMKDGSFKAKAVSVERS